LAILFRTFGLFVAIDLLGFPIFRLFISVLDEGYFRNVW
jgi:hypothetical protein